MKNINEYRNIGEYLKERDQIKKGMNRMVEETAQELGYDSVKILNYGGDLTSRNIGLHTGPVGGVVVQKLIASAQRQLMEDYNNSH